MTNLYGLLSILCLSAFVLCLCSLYNWYVKQEVKNVVNRGCSDESLKWTSTANLCTLALARLMEAQGVDDQPLIDELYARGRAEAKAHEKVLKK